METIEMQEEKAQALRDTAAVLRAAIAMLEASAQFAEDAAQTARTVFWAQMDSEMERACNALEGRTP